MSAVHFADAFEGSEHFARGVILQVVKTAKIEVAACQRIREQAGVESFLPAEADAQQLGVGELQEVAESPGSFFFQSVVSER